MHPQLSYYVEPTCSIALLNTFMIVQYVLSYANVKVDIGLFNLSLLKISWKTLGKALVVNIFGRLEPFSGTKQLNACDYNSPT